MPKYMENPSIPQIADQEPHHDENSGDKTRMSFDEILEGFRSSFKSWEIEAVDYYLDDDPLKSQTEAIISAFKFKKFDRFLNPETRMFEKPDEEWIKDEIFNIRYPNALGHPQKGHFAVVADSVNPIGKVTGFGWVESFEDKYDAERCAYIIRRINPAHNPAVVDNSEW
ncbi:MAG: hypothetical protein PHC70_02740 [Patescibacteria group bacterium]|nr:hypothetical protein [Patescibacteria group bacterium]